ncbi:MAG: UvrD-helicase domain-containing protein [Bacteroidales bacterium]|nr:UvrD-helicase domain-containing protein [Bacteroidales bacterium]
MSQVKIYSASAGSGKTFNLVVEYLEKLLTNPYSFKNILAVTFTNKSTNEMKTRILSTLYGLATNQPYANKYIPKLEDKTHKSEKEIREKANDILKIILHDYSYFNIETIDSFLQKVLKNLAKEVKVGSRFDVILDETEYIEKAIKQVNNSEQLKPYVEKLIDKRLEEGENWKHDNILLDISKDLNKQIVRENIENQSIDFEEIEKYVKNQKAIYDNFLKELHSKIEDFKKQYNVKSFIKKEFVNANYKLVKEEEPFNKKARKKGTENSYDEIVEFFERGKAKALKAKLEINSVYESLLLKSIKNFKAEALKEDNLFVLKETAGLLSEMIGEDDVSFVYEKVGAKINHVMIDEFQDTSQQSWNNFKFISNECGSKQGSTTIFGDLKQSIYRWNEGDWTIMSELLNEEKDNEKNLNENWRTDENIVKFNNKFFKEKIYTKINFETKVEQIAKNNIGQGLLKFHFINEGKDIDVLEKTIEEINYYIEKGFKHSDIALLFRSNLKLVTTAEYLKSKGLTPISDDAFTFNTSRSIKTIIFALRLIANNKDAFSQYLLSTYGYEENTINLLKTIDTKNIPLVDIVNSIINICKIETQDIFISAFYEKLTEFCGQKPQQISGFIKYWNDELKDFKILLDDNNGNEKENDKNIKLLTVHKSKGLEFPIVIIPFFDWQYINKTNKLWEYNYKEDCPVKLFRATLSELKKTQDTIYSKSAEIEEENQKIDTYNLMYVAFTRPKHSLCTISKKPKDNLCSEDLLSYLSDNYSCNSENCFIIGNEDLKKEISKEESEQKDIFSLKGENITPSIKNTNFEKQDAVKFSLSKQAQDYFEFNSEESSEEKRERGIALHSICSKIYEEKDLETLSLPEEEKAIIEQMFIEAKEYKWFDGTYKTYNEKEILCNGQTKRIDRIMFGKDEVIIVDYKFSEDTDYEDKYRKQLNEYKKIVSEMGYKNIKTYLWFIGNEIKEIK